MNLGFYCHMPCKLTKKSVFRLKKLGPIALIRHYRLVAVCCCNMCPPLHSNSFTSAMHIVYIRRDLLICWFESQPWTRLGKVVLHAYNWMIYGLSPSDLFMNGFGTDTYAGLYICSRHSHTTCDPFTPPLRPVPQPMTTVFLNAAQLLRITEKIFSCAKMECKRNLFSI